MKEQEIKKELQIIELKQVVLGYQQKELVAMLQKIQQQKPCVETSVAYDENGVEL
jgi:hypothetical protein